MIDRLTDLIFENYGWIPTSIEQLQGYEDRTYLVVKGVAPFILKVHLNTGEITRKIEQESDLMRHFASLERYNFPQPVLTLNQALYVLDSNYIIRILNFLEGSFLGDLEPQQWPEKQLGRMFGEITAHAQSFASLAQGLKPSAWDLQHLLIHKPVALSSDLLPSKLASQILYFIQQFELVVQPHAYTLRKSFIHNDGNEWNIVLQNQEVTGLIDFGDSCYSWTVNELAVGMTYVLMQRQSPLEAATQMLIAFHEVFPLEPLEIDLLYYLIAGRLCISLCNSAKAIRETPDSEYIGISSKPAANLLELWLQINPIHASNTFRTALGFNPSSQDENIGLPKMRTRFFSAALSLSYNRPITMEKAAFQYMYGADGSTYLDAYNNIMLVGHSHPYLGMQGARAMNTLNTNTRYHYRALYSYTEKLLAHFPKKLSKVFFVNSGSAATDLALRLARKYTGRRTIAALEYGYHGNTESGIAVSHYKHRHGVLYPDTLVCPLPNLFEYHKSGIESNGSILGSQCTVILQDSNQPIAGFIAEPIVGCGGQVPLPKGYLKLVYEKTRTLGGVCISDEVQVGFGRLGSHFWGFEMHEVEPDIVILGKPIGNGHPMGAVVCTQEIAEAFAQGPEFFSSFGGNPVSCAIGEAVLDVIQKETLQQQALKTGNYLKNQMLELKSHFAHIADVRGAGMFLGIELLEEMHKPATQWAAQIKNGLRDNSVLIGTDGPHDNVLKIKPPLTFNTLNCDEITSKMYDLLKYMPY
ncbi:MAG: hypothetical protein RLZZ241_1873 [Bacteroidota bacterium]|jgi:4-aminobutyrate aminotransferase-like enzyme/Ser/Thr protein kinase RdoA (MazF antagonist)